MVLRRVERDVVVALPIEERDVLGFRARLGVRQRVEAAGPYFRHEVSRPGQERPGVAAQVAQIDAERFRRLLAEHLLGAPRSSRRVTPPARRAVPVDVRLEISRIEADERRVEARVERLASAEDLHLPFFRVGRRMKVHRASPQEDERRDALIDVGHEHGTVRERQVEVLGGDVEVVRGELSGGIEAETVQVVDRRHAFLIGDGPLAIAAGFADAFDVEPPRRHARARAELGERVHHEAVSVPGQRAGEARAIPLLHDGAAGARHQLRAGKVERAVPARRIGHDREVRRRVARLHDSPDPIEKQTDAVVFPHLRGAVARAQQERQGTIGTASHGKRDSASAGTFIPGRLRQSRLCQDPRNGTRTSIPSSPADLANTSSANCSSSCVCVAVTIVRTRALSRATVGNAMPCANTPSSNSRSDSFMASAPSPTMTGVIGLSLRPVLKPSACRPDLKNRVFSHSRSMICGSCSSTSSAAMHVAATAGGCDVEKRNGRARW